jgi:hypothetical protein
MARSSCFTESRSTHELTANLDPDEMGRISEAADERQTRGNNEVLFANVRTHHRFGNFSDDLASG